MEYQKNFGRGKYEEFLVIMDPSIFINIFYKVAHRH